MPRIFTSSDPLDRKAARAPGRLEHVQIALAPGAEAEVAADPHLADLQGVARGTRWMNRSAVQRENSWRERHDEQRVDVRARAAALPSERA